MLRSHDARDRHRRSLAGTEGCQSEQSESIPTALLDQIEKALHDITVAVLAVAPSLEKPYPDDPRWTPWTRFVERPGEAAMEAHTALKAARRI